MSQQFWLKNDKDDDDDDDDDYDYEVLPQLRFIQKLLSDPGREGEPNPGNSTLIG